MLKEFIVFLRNFKLYLSLIFIISVISVFLLSNVFLTKGLDNPSIKIVLEPNSYPKNNAEQYLYKVNETIIETSFSIDNNPDFDRFLEDIHTKIRKVFENNSEIFNNYKLINYKMKYEGDRGIWLWFELSNFTIFNDDEKLLSELSEIIYNVLENEINLELSFFEIVSELIDEKRKFINSEKEILRLYPECKNQENIENYQEMIFCIDVQQRNKYKLQEFELHKVKTKSINFLNEYVEKRINFYKKNNLFSISIVSKTDNKQRQNSTYILSILISLFLTFLITLFIFLSIKLRKN